MLAATLARMGARADKISAFANHGDEAAPSYVAEFSPGAEDSSDLDEEVPPEVLEDESVLAELTEMNFAEEQATYIFAMVENRPPFRKRSWKENKRFKADMKKDRSSFVKGAGGTSHGPRGRLTKEQLKKISKCNTCGKRGHCSEDCRQASSTGATAAPPTQKMSGFCYLGGSASASGASHYSFMAWNSEDHGFYGAHGDIPSWGYLTIPPGVAILDTGATQDIIGDHALAALEDELSCMRLQAVTAPTPSSAITGIGGQAKVLKAVLIPVAFGGVPGVVRVIVIEGAVPPLLSVGLLAHLGVKLDLETEEIQFKALDVKLPMIRLPSGHSTVPLVQWEGGRFEVPDTAKEQYQLSDDAFMKGSALSAYANKGFCEDAGFVEFGDADEPSLKPVKPGKRVRFQVAEPAADVSCGALTDTDENSMIYSSRQVQGELRRELCDRAAFDSAAQMSQCLDSSRSKFDFPRDRDRGSLVLFDERRGRPSASGDALEKFDGKGVSDVGDHPPGLPSFGSCRDHPEEHPFREAQVSHGRCPGAWEVPSPGKVLGQDILHSEESSVQGQGAGTTRRPFRLGHGVPSSLATSSTTRTSVQPVPVLTGFREVSNSLKDLAQGQSQMMVMMQRGMQADISGLSLDQVQELVNKTIDAEMQVDNEEDATPLRQRAGLQWHPTRIPTSSICLPVASEDDLVYLGDSAAVVDADG